MKQKSTRTNRFLAMLLAVVMLLSMLPVLAFAADLPVTSTTGTWKDIAVGVELFTDKSNCTVKTLPEELAGMKYLHDCMYTANVAAATGDVYIYVLTPSLEMPDYSQQKALEAVGFTAVKTYPVAAITSDLGEPMVLMEKKFSDGDSVTLPMWGIILASETKLGGESEPAGFTLKDLASVDVTGGSLEKVASGGKLFADRENHLFGDAIPAWLDGTSYLCANLAAVSATVTKAGWVYVLTPVTGAPDTQQAALEAAGYEKVETIPMANFSSGTIENDMAVMAKEVKAGDVISYAAWGILLAEATVEVPAVAPTSGSMKTLALNELVFSDKPYKFTTVPEYLSGVSYVCAPISSTGATFNVDGYAYVLTPVPAEGNAGLYSQQAKLESEGYKLIKTYEVGALSTDLGESLAMMGKKVTAGDSISLPMWGIILFSETKLNVADAVGDPDDGGNSGEDPDDGGQEQPFQFGQLAKVEGAGASVITSGALMFTDRQHAFHPQLPDYLEGLDYVKGPMTGGTRTVTVTEAGWVYFLTPTTGIDTQQAALEEAGYETLYVIPVGVIGTTIGEAMAVMGKECAVGEVAHAGQWAIMIAKGDPEFDPNVISLKAPLVQINPTTETESYQDGQRTWQGIPSIARDDESGRLWATWYGGDADFPGEGRTNFVMLYTSDDDGATWTGPKVVIDPHYTARSSDMRAFDPNLWVDPDGKMWFIWNQSNGHFDGRGGVWAIYTENPGAEDPTWSEPKRLANGIIMCDPTVLTKASGDLPAGAWVMPTAIWDGPSTGAADVMNDPNYADERYSNCYVSLDKGETWTLQGSVLEYDMVRDCDENMIIQQPDGSLRMWIRAKGGIAESISRDGGKTWSKATNTGVSPVVSRFWVGWLDEETQLAVFNDPPSGGNSRSHMTAALSFDGGNTWSEKFVVEEGGGCSYPDVHIGEDGFIYITYDAGRFNPMARVFMCKITKEDIIAGELVNENSKLSVLINNNSVCEVTDITLNETKYTLNVKNEETLQLTAEVTFSNNTNVDKSVVWASSDESVATVDQNGLVTAVSDGVAAISVTANNNGLSKECVLTINGYAAKEVEEAKAAAEAAKKEAEEAKAAAEAAKKEAEEAKAKLEAAEKAAEENKAKLEAAEKAAAEAKAKQEAAEKAAEEAKVKQEAAEKALEELLKGENPKPEDPKPEEPKPIENPFVDIEEDMFCYDAVLWAYENEITTGKDATHFNPSGNCTRSQVVTFLWRAAGEPEPKSSENPFPDVATGKFYTEAVLWAVENGITAGFKDGTFGPDKTCTRDQIVTFLWRFAGEPEPKSTENTFPDVKADAFYTDAVLWAVENGITTGYKDGTFGPSKTCKRDQIVTFLYRYMAE